MALITEIIKAAVDFKFSSAALHKVSHISPNENRNQNEQEQSSELEARTDSYVVSKSDSNCCCYL
jgi:hypothetical protein